MNFSGCIDDAFAAFPKLTPEIRLRQTGALAAVRWTALQTGRGFCATEKQSKARLPQWVAESARALKPPDRTAFRTLLLAMAERRASILQERKHVGAMSRLAGSPRAGCARRRASR